VIVFNAAELNRVLNHCEAHPEQHDQFCYFGYSGNYDTVWIYGDEGAPALADGWRHHIVACVAGWTVILNGWRPIHPTSLRIINDAGETADAVIMAKQLLGLTSNQAAAMFRTQDLAGVRQLAEGIENQGAES
jgi:hypothetical protein